MRADDVCVALQAEIRLRWSVNVSILEKTGIRVDPGVEDPGSRRYPFELLDLRQTPGRLSFMWKVVVESIFSVRSLTFLSANCLSMPFGPEFSGISEQA